MNLFDGRLVRLNVSASEKLSGTVYTGTVIRAPKKMQTGSGAPSFCWQCGNQLRRAQGKGRGLFFFNLVTGPDGHMHRIHGDCTEQAILDGCKLLSVPSGVWGMMVKGENDRKSDNA